MSDSENVISENDYNDIVKDIVPINNSGSVSEQKIEFPPLDRDIIVENITYPIVTGPIPNVFDRIKQEHDALNNIPNSLDNQQILQKLTELEVLKAKVEKLLMLSNIGDEEGEKVRKELETYKKLKTKGVEIKHLEEKYKNELYPTRRSDKSKHKKIPLESEIRDALKNTPSSARAAKYLGVCVSTFNKYIKLYGIVNPRKGQNFKYKNTHHSPKVGKFPIDQILLGRHPNFPVHRLKDKLVRGGYKKAECEHCGFNDRRMTDGKLPLLLNFDDGNNKNHKLENLKLLCYNCTFTVGRGYFSKGCKTWDPDLLQDAPHELDQRF